MRLIERQSLSCIAYICFLFWGNRADGFQLQHKTRNSEPKGFFSPHVTLRATTATIDRSSVDTSHIDHEKLLQLANKEGNGHATAISSLVSSFNNTMAMIQSRDHTSTEINTRVTAFSSDSLSVTHYGSSLDLDCLMFDIKQDFDELSRAGLNLALLNGKLERDMKIFKEENTFEIDSIQSMTKELSAAQKNLDASEKKVAILKSKLDKERRTKDVLLTKIEQNKELKAALDDSHSISQKKWADRVAELEADIANQEAIEGELVATRAEVEVLRRRVDSIQSEADRKTANYKQKMEQSAQSAKFVQDKLEEEINLVSRSLRTAEEDTKELRSLLVKEAGHSREAENKLRATVAALEKEAKEFEATKFLLREAGKKYRVATVEAALVRRENGELRTQVLTGAGRIQSLEAEVARKEQDLEETKRALGLRMPEMDRLIRALYEQRGEMEEHISQLKDRINKEKQFAKAELIRTTARDRAENAALESELRDQQLKVEQLELEVRVMAQARADERAYRGPGSLKPEQDRLIDRLIRQREELNQRVLDLQHRVAIARRNGVDGVLRAAAMDREASRGVDQRLREACLRRDRLDLELRSQQQARAEERALLTCQVQTLTAELGTNTAMVKQYRGEMRAAQKRIQGLAMRSLEQDRQVVALQTEYDRFKATAQTQAAAYEKQIDSLTKELGELRSLVKDREAEVKKMKGLWSKEFMEKHRQRQKFWIKEVELNRRILALEEERNSLKALVSVLSRKVVTTVREAVGKGTVRPQIRPRQGLDQRLHQRLHQKQKNNPHLLGHRGEIEAERGQRQRQGQGQANMTMKMKVQARANNILPFSFLSRMRVRDLITPPKVNLENYPHIFDESSSSATAGAGTTSSGGTTSRGVLIEQVEGGTSLVPDSTIPENLRRAHDHSHDQQDQQHDHNARGQANTILHRQANADNMSPSAPLSPYSTDPAQPRGSNRDSTTGSSTGSSAGRSSRFRRVPGELRRRISGTFSYGVNLVRRDMASSSSDGNHRN